MIFKNVTHVLFDLDGLLIDSERLYTEAFSNICAKYDKEFTWELKRSILGFQGHECAERIIKTLDLPLTGESFMEECKKEYEKCLVFEDAVNGVKAALAANMQVVVVPDPRIDTEDLKHATLCLKSLEDFQPELFGLPPFD
ncbi:Pseudouridine-5'-monophosphatase [Papilio machaon]|uniref:Pseudouridine-5'-monophosphatase n=1 Tax=Papilio machaon TaxID=76193 RepID=A0A194QZ70_PAPMA|nr:Pseudouridine-5'-monophosphatase [Papilio machaon]